MHGRMRWILMSDVERRCACTKGEVFFVDKMDDKGRQQSERRRNILEMNE